MGSGYAGRCTTPVPPWEQAHPTSAMLPPLEYTAPPLAPPFAPSFPGPFPPPDAMSLLRSLMLALTLLAPMTVAAQTDAGKILGQIRLSDLQGRSIRLDPAERREVIINFWARWCPPCRAEIPDLVAAQARLKGHPQIIGIAIEEDAPAVAGFTRQMKVNYPIYLSGDAGMGLMRELGNQRMILPYTVAIDRQGRIVAQHSGRLSARDLETLAAAAGR